MKGKEVLFKSLEEIVLKIKVKGKFIIFETEELTKSYNFSLHFRDEDFKSLLKHLYETANSLWDDFTPKEATGIRSDYTEYYDKALDSNGYLRLLENGFQLERPVTDNLKVYQFNKGRLESLIHDAKLILKTI